MITVFLVDDQERTRRGLRLRLSVEPDIRVIGDAGDGAAALAAIQDLQPDVVILDLHMPGMDGIAVARALHTTAPAARLVMLSLDDEAEARRCAHAAGIDAFISKAGTDDDLLSAIRGEIHGCLLEPAPPFGGDGFPPKVGS